MPPPGLNRVTEKLKVENLRSSATERCQVEGNLSVFTPAVVNINKSTEASLTTSVVSFNIK